MWIGQYVSRVNKLGEITLLTLLHQHLLMHLLLLVLLGTVHELTNEQYILAN